MARVAVASRQHRILAGIVALRDVTRALRGSGASRKGEAAEAERGVLFDLASLTDRLAAYADDQTEDDWDQFWLTEQDVALLRQHTVALEGVLRGISPATMPALVVLADELATVAHVPD